MHAKRTHICVYMSYVNFIVKSIAFRIKYIGFIHKFIYRLYSWKHKVKLQFIQLRHLFTFHSTSLLMVTLSAVVLVNEQNQKLLKQIWKSELHLQKKTSQKTNTYTQKKQYPDRWEKMWWRQGCQYHLINRNCVTFPGWRLSLERYRTCFRTFYAGKKKKNNHYLQWLVCISRIVFRYNLVFITRYKIG